MGEIYPPEEDHLYNQLIKLLERQWNAYDNLNHLPRLLTTMTDHSPTRRHTFQTSMAEPGDWGSLTLVKQDHHVQEFSEELRG